MASQTIQDVKAIYEAAKAKLDSLPPQRSQEVMMRLTQWIMAGVVTLMVVVAIFFMQLLFARKEAELARQDLSEDRWQAERYFKEAQRLQKELDSKKP